MTTVPVLRQLKQLILTQLSLGLALAILAWPLGGLQLSASFAVGVVLMSINVAGLAWGWWRIVTQKTIAWSVLIIVIKYAVLLGSTYYLARLPGFNAVGAGLGIASFVIAALIWAVILQKEKS